MEDKKHALKKLQTAVRSIKLSPPLDVKEIDIGSPKEYLRLYHYLFLDYSAPIASEIVNKHNMELNLKNDKLFIDGIYKLVRDMLGYVPKLTKDQFFQTSFAKIKALMAAEIIELIQQKNKASGGLTSSTSCVISSLSAQPAVTSTVSKNPVHEASENTENIAHIENQTSPRPVHHQHHPVQRQQSTKTPLLSNSQSLNSIHASSSNNKIYGKARLAHVDSREYAPLKQHDINVNGNQTTTNDLLTNELKKLVDSANEKITDVFGKLENVMKRVENLEKTMESYKINHAEAQSQSQQANYSDELNRISKTCELLSNKFTLVETDILLIKQNLTKSSNNNNNSLNNGDRLDDTAAYETPFQSFMATSPKDLNDSSYNPVIMQGVPYDVGGVLDHLNGHDMTINSTDSTPTLKETLPESKLSMSKKNPFKQSDDFVTESSISRAKELIQRASNLNSLISSNIKV